MQAVAAYTPRVEELIRRRASLLRREAAPRRESGYERASPRPEEQDDAEASSDRERPDPVERFAQDGFGALERFGAELEALFMGPPPRRPTKSPSAAQETTAATAPPTAAAASSLVEIEAELNRLLMEQGIVVRGHDIARVVGLMSGKEVTWPA
jgi:hypothetical protein